MDHTELNNKNLNQPYEFVVHTFGCKVNTYDTGLIQKNLNQNGYSSQNKKTQNEPIHILNTCAVTSEATQQAVRMIRKIKSKQPLATVIITGCAAQVDTGQFENLPGATLVVANSHKGMLPQILDQYFKGELKQKTFKSNIFKKEDLEVEGGLEDHHTRSFLKIQDGCNSFCSFCIIPYARGKSRSIPISQLIQKIRHLESQGIKEVVLTGVHIGDYLDDSTQKKRNMDDLVEEVLNQTRISRVRLSSLEPIEISDRLLELYKNDRLCPHFHMSIQSADTQVLKEMKRNYSEVQVRESLLNLAQKVPNSFIGMDVIAGFPTETDEQFENTYKVLSETPWTRLHVFPYSERQGTKAAVFPQMHIMKRKERAARLRELSLHRLQSEALKQIGTFKKALVLNKPNSNYSAISRDYWNIQFDHNALDFEKIKNTEVNVLVKSIELNDLDVVLKANYV